MPLNLKNKKKIEKRNQKKRERLREERERDEARNNLLRNRDYLKELYQDYYNSLQTDDLKGFEYLFDGFHR